MTPKRDATVRIPAAALAVMADRCDELGEDAVDALREAGRVAGEAVAERVFDVADPEEASPEAFWEAVGQEFVELGLGPVTFQLRRTDVAEVSMEGLPEADGVPGEPRRRTGCPFATGLLTGLLTAAAGEPVSVLEAECRADGAAACRFLVGGRGPLERTRRRMTDGASLSEALEGP